MEKEFTKKMERECFKHSLSKREVLFLMKEQNLSFEEAIQSLLKRREEALRDHWEWVDYN